MSGGSKKYERAVEFLMNGELVKKFVTCLVFYEKPKKFLIYGETKGGSKGTALSSDVLSYLPLHPDSFLQELANSQDEEDKIALQKRQQLPEGFQRINFTQVRIVALMGIQAACDAGKLLGSIHKDFMMKHRNTPYSGHVSQSEFKSEATFKIRKLHIEKFRDEKPYSEEGVKKLQIAISGL